jgi:hypothetical protein
MHIKISGIEIGTVPGRSPYCTREQARELLEGLRTAYQSLLPAERIMVGSMIAQSARSQLEQVIC